MSTAPFRHMLTVADVGAEGRSIRLTPDPEERDALARELGVDAVLALDAPLRVTVSRDGVARVAGRLSATVRQTCVVTLDPVTSDISEEIDLTLVPGGEDQAVPGHGVREDEPPDVYFGGMIDLGAIVSEFLALGIDPYPRASGVEFSSHLEEGNSNGDGPFAALRRLRRGNGS